MPDRKPNGDPLETNMPHRRPTCLIGDQHASLETHQRPTCLIRDLTETHMPGWRPIRDQHAFLETDMTHRRPMTCLIGDPWEIHILPKVGLRWCILVSDEACWSPMGLQWGKLVSDQACHLQWVSNEACRSPMGLRWVYNSKNIFVDSNISLFHYALKNVGKSSFIGICTRQRTNFKNGDLDICTQTCVSFAA